MAFDTNYNVPGDNTRGRPSIREYNIVISSAADFKFLDVQGNYVELKSVTSAAPSPFNLPSTIFYQVQTLLEIDDSVLSFFPGDKWNRNYSRIRIAVPDAVSDMNFAYPVTVTLRLGFGDGDNNRRAPLTPVNGFTRHVIVPDDGIWTAPVEGGFQIKETRLCVPVDQPNGLMVRFFTDAFEDGFWLERGQVDWIDYSGPLQFRNDGSGGDVLITIARLVNRQ
jgi:hypothetical protein